MLLAFQKKEEEPLKQIFAQEVLVWIEKTLREAVVNLQSDPDLKIATRIATGSGRINHKTGRKVQILYSAFVRIKPHPTEVTIYIGNLEQVRSAFHLSKRAVQFESAKAHTKDN